MRDSTDIKIVTGQYTSYVLHVYDLINDKRDAKDVQIAYDKLLKSKNMLDEEHAEYMSEITGYIESNR